MQQRRKLTGQLGRVIDLLELIAQDPTQPARSLERDREFVRMALSAEGGVAEALDWIAKRPYLRGQDRRVAPLSESTLLRYVLALCLDALAGLRDGRARIVDGRWQPDLTLSQRRLLDRIEAVNRGEFGEVRTAPRATYRRAGGSVPKRVQVVVSEPV